MLTDEYDPDETYPSGAHQHWDYTACATAGGKDVVPIDSSDGLGNETIYSYNTSTGDLLSSEQEVTPGTPEVNGLDTTPGVYNQNQNTAQGGDPITSYVYTSIANSGANDPTGAPYGLVLSTTNPDGDVTAYSYDTAGNPTATYQGQTIAMASNSAAFDNLGPGAARTYDLYAYSTTTLSGTYTVEDGSQNSLPLTTPASYLPASALGSNWYFLGQVTLDSSSSLVVNYSGSSPAEAISLLQPTSTTAYDSQEDPLSQTDAMGTISASTFDNLGRPVAASQGQAVNVASGGPATFANLPLAPGLARTYTLYGNRRPPPAATPSRRTARAPSPDHQRAGDHALGRRGWRLVRTGRRDPGPGQYEHRVYGELFGRGHGFAGGLPGADLGHGLRRGRERAFAGRRFEPRHDLRLQQRRTADFHLARADRARRFGRPPRSTTCRRRRARPGPTRSTSRSPRLTAATR